MSLFSVLPDKDRTRLLVHWPVEYDGYLGGVASRPVTSFAVERLSPVPRTEPVVEEIWGSRPLPAQPEDEAFATALTCALSDLSAAAWRLGLWMSDDESAEIWDVVTSWVEQVRCPTSSRVRSLSELDRFVDEEDPDPMGEFAWMLDDAAGRLLALVERLPTPVRVSLAEELLEDLNAARECARTPPLGRSAQCVSSTLMSDVVPSGDSWRHRFEDLPVVPAAILDLFPSMTVRQAWQAAVSYRLLRRLAAERGRWTGQRARLTTQVLSGDFGIEVERWTVEQHDDLCGMAMHCQVVVIAPSSHSSWRLLIDATYDNGEPGPRVDRELDSLEELSAVWVALQTPIGPWELLRGAAATG